MSRPDHERYHKHGPSTDPYDMERAEMRALETGQTFGQALRDVLACPICGSRSTPEAHRHYTPEHSTD